MKKIIGLVNVFVGEDNFSEMNRNRDPANWHANAISNVLLKK